MVHIGRRGLLRGGIALGAVAGVGAGAWAFGGAGTTAQGPALRLGYLPITDSAPLLVAHGRGLFERAGVTVRKPVLFRSWASVAEAFLAREVDVIHLLMPYAVALRYEFGAAVRIIAWSHTNGSALTVAPRTDRVQLLAGQKVAIPYWWSIHNVVLQDILRDSGLRAVVREQPAPESKTVELVVMSPADMLPALHSGTIGGYIVADPFNAAAEAQQAGRIQRFVGDAWRDHACCVVVAHQELLDQSPHQVQALVNGLADAQQLISNDRPGAAEILSNGYLPQPRNAITRALTYPAEEYQQTGALHHPEWQGQTIGFQPFPFASFTERLIDAMRQTVIDGDTSFLQRLDTSRVHEQLVDDRFARRAIERAGGPAAFGLPATLSRVEEVNPA